MKRNEFIEFCNENMWHKFMPDEAEDKQWKHREKMARADLLISQRKTAGDSKRQIMTAIVDATGVSRQTASKWIAHWEAHHEK